MRPISHDKNTHLGKNYVTMTDLMEFLIKTELSDFICEECTKSSGVTSKTNFEEKQTLLKSPTQLRISLQISNFNDEKTNYVKIKQK